MLVLQIALGIWLGLSLTVVTFVAFMEARDRIQRNLRYGRPWWAGFIIWAN